MATDFSQSNAKLMATALFFEYMAYSVFNIMDSVKKEGPEYVFVDEKLRQAQEANAKAKKEKKQKDKEEKQSKKEQSKKDKQDKKSKYYIRAYNR